MSIRPIRAPSSGPEDRHPRSILLRVLCGSVVLLLVLVPGMASAALLDPLDFTSLGTLSLSAGNYTIDTDSLTIVDDSDPNMPLFTGIADDQNGTADYLNGVWAPGSMGIPQIAVFAFDDIDIQSTATITVTGTRALAFVSHGNAVIDTTIDLSGEGVESVVFTEEAPPGAPRFGGFGGGFAPFGQPSVAGDGPGGGGTGPSFSGGSGGFGGPGESVTMGSIGGMPYGDLVSGPLQGGSGGGSAGTFGLGGAAGGGAIEIGAIGSVTLGANGALIASGGIAEGVETIGITLGGGAGSGGGVRIAGQSVNLLGAIDASASKLFAASVTSRGGGGRVAVFGSSQLFDFVVGVTDPSLLNTSTINVEGGKYNASDGSRRGLISVSPQVTTIPSGQSLTLGQATDLSDANRRLELVHRNIRVQQGGQAVVPAEGYVNHAAIELFPGGSTISGPGVLDNRGELSGRGTVEAAVENNSGGTIDAINDELTFTAAVTNNPGGQINAINSTLHFQAGLTNNGELNLINTNITGSVLNTLTSSSTLVGSNSVSGDFEQAAGDALFIDLGGTLPGEFDTLTIGGNATLAGDLNVSLDPGFLLSLGDSFEIVDVTGSTSGTFNGLNDGALVGSFSGTNLFINYNAGDGNDVALFASAGLPGDYNGNDMIDAADYTVWRDALTAGATSLTNDPTPGTVDESDFAYWRAHFGETLGSGAGAGTAAAVPEPATLTMLLMASLAMLSCRARQFRQLGGLRGPGPDYDEKCPINPWFSVLVHCSCVGSSPTG